MSLSGVLFRVLLSFLGSIPYPILYRTGKLLSFLIRVFPNKHKNITKVNLGVVFKDKTIEERRELLKKSLFHSSMNFLESGIVWNKKNFKKIEANIDIYNVKAVNNSLWSDRGVLLITPHLGNIEVIINYLGSEFDCTIPYTKPKNSTLDKVITESRNSLGVNMVNIDSSGIKQILSTLKNNKLVTIASDQVPKEGSGIVSSFFENEIYSMTLVPKLKEKTHCSVHVVFCLRKDNGKGFNIYFSDEIDISSSVKEGVDKMNIEFENCIMKAPEQYSWEYKKFKRTNLNSLYKGI